MLRTGQAQSNRRDNRAEVRLANAWLLCVLLVIFCAKAKLTNDDAGKHSLRPAAAQPVLSSDRVRRYLLKARLLVLPYLVTGAIARFADSKEFLLSADAPASCRKDTSIRSCAGGLHQLHRLKIA